MGETRLRLLRAWLLLEEEEFEKGINSQWAKKAKIEQLITCVYNICQSLNNLRFLKEPRRQAAPFEKKSKTIEANRCNGLFPKLHLFV